MSVLRVYWYEMGYQCKDHKDTIRFMDILDLHGKTLRTLSTKREKERDPTQSFHKSPYTDIKIQKATWQHKNATNNFFQ